MKGSLGGRRRGRPADTPILSAEAAAVEGGAREATRAGPRHKTEWLSCDTAPARVG